MKKLLIINSPRGINAASKRNFRHLFKRILFINLFFLAAFSVSAQTKIPISGIVKDDKGVPTANVSVTVKGSTAGATTDVNGAFLLMFPVRNLHLSFRMWALKPRKYRLVIKLLLTYSLCPLQIA